MHIFRERYQFVCFSSPFCFMCGMDFIVLIPDNNISFYFARMFSHVTDSNATYTILTVKLPEQSISIINFERRFYSLIADTIH